MAPSIDSMVFSLRRKAVRERTELAAEDFAFAFYLQWKRVARSEIEVIDLMRELSPKDTFLPNLSRVLCYLERCKRTGQAPKSRQITIRICPWAATEADEFL